jgi:Glycosyl transferase family group 2
LKTIQLLDRLPLRSLSQSPPTCCKFASTAGLSIHSREVAVPRLAIVIPAVGTAESLEATLLTVLENRPVDCEVVAVTNFDYADPYDLGNEVRFVSAQPEADAVSCAAAAISVVRSPVVHVLAAGCEVSEGWADRALDHFSDLSVGAVAPLVLRLDRRDQVLSAGIDYRAGGARRLRVMRLRRVADAGPTKVFGACHQAAFFRRSALESVGGWKVDVGPELADVELAWALHRAGYRTVLEPAACVHGGSPTKSTLGAFRQGVCAERLFWRNASSVGWLKALAAHGWLVGLETLANLSHPSKLTTLAGRAWGAIDLRYYLRGASPVTDEQNDSSDSDGTPPSDSEPLRIDRGQRGAMPTGRAPRRMRTA